MVKFSEIYLFSKNEKIPCLTSFGNSSSHTTSKRNTQQKPDFPTCLLTASFQNHHHDFQEIQSMEQIMILIVQIIKYKPLITNSYWKQVRINKQLDSFLHCAIILIYKQSISLNNSASCIGKLVIGNMTKFIEPGDLN